MPEKISKGSQVTLPTTDLVGTVILCRGQVVEVQWPDNSVRLHQRRFLIKVAGLAKFLSTGGAWMEDDQG